jgi:DNA-binding transcriptional ArsR family regulator
MSEPGRAPPAADRVTADVQPFSPATVAAAFRAFADPGRLRLLRAMTMECKSVSQLAQEASLPQPLASHHLRILRDAGLARHQRRGGYMFY